VAVAAAVIQPAVLAVLAVAVRGQILAQRQMDKQTSVEVVGVRLSQRRLPHQQTVALAS